MSPELSVVIPVRDRAGVRLANCLRSLRWQQLPALETEVIISDFGSAPDQMREIEQLAAEFEARVLRTETTEDWNKSRALNLGIRTAQGRFVMCTDADMVFQANFLASLLGVQTEQRGEALAVCRCRDLPRSLELRDWRVDDYESLREAAPYRGKLGTGACQMMERRVFGELGGYDEGYVFWGMEDNDLQFRATRAGRKLVWVEDRTSMLHQWHPSSRGVRPVRKFLNDLRFHLTKYQVVKNRGRDGPW